MQGPAPNGREALDQSRELPTSCMSFLGRRWQMTTHGGSEQQKPVPSQAGDQPSGVRVSQCCAPFRGSSQGSVLPLPVFWAPGVPWAHIVSLCPKGFVKFYAGDFSLDDVPHSGWPVEVDHDQIETFTKDSQHYTMQEIDDILEISSSSAKNYLH